MTNEPQLQVPLDGLFLSPIPPWGASVLVVRDRRDVLLVRRRSNWGPPAVTRLPDEPVAACAARALEEIVGFTLPLWPVADADPAWAVFVARANSDARVRLGNGYDECEWVPIERAGDRCTDLVSDTLHLVA
jgi:hypothetical protein